MNTYPSPDTGRVAGATGYAGQELVGLLARHPNVRLEAAMSSSRRFGGPAAAAAGAGLGRRRRAAEHRTARQRVDLVFLAVPEKAAAELAPPLVEAGVRVIDLSGAFRIRDGAARSRWYPATETCRPARRMA